MLPLREIPIFGMLVDPAAVLLVLCAAAYVLARLLVNRFIDLDQFVWRRPLVDLAVFVVMYCVTILTLRPI
jgi:hypothetical protein